MWNAAGRGHVRTEGLPANRIRDKNRNLSAEDGDGRVAVGKTARDTLCGHAVVIVLHVWVGRSDAQSQVREVPTTLWGATKGVLGSPRERQAEGGGERIPRGGEPNQESYGQ